MKQGLQPCSHRLSALTESMKRACQSQFSHLTASRFVSKAESLLSPQRLQSVLYLTELRQPKRRLHFLKNTICSPQAEEIITFMLPIQTVTVVLLSTIATAMTESLLLQSRLLLQTFL